MPLGIIVDQNPNAASVDLWALVTGTTVVNTIESDYAGIQNIQSSYDYLVDLTEQGQVAGIGWTYAPQTDTFTGPSTPPPDWITVVEDDFDNLVDDLLQCLQDAGEMGGNLSPTDLAQAFSNATLDSQASYTPNQAALMLAIYQYILGGG
jgi:hypothetical protein